MSDTDQHPALTFVMSAHHLLSVVRRHFPSQETVIRLDGLARTGFGAAEMAGGTALLANPDPILSKIGGAALVAHGMDMIASGNRAWNTGQASPTMTERAARGAALMAHASPIVADMAGATADALVPIGILHMVGAFAATRAIRVASADAHHLIFEHSDIHPEHFHQPAPACGQPANRNLILPHRQSSLNLADHEAPPHNRKAGGHVLLKHVSPTEEYIERRFTKGKQFLVSFFTSKHEAERVIHQVLQDNAHLIDRWLETAGPGAEFKVTSNISGRGTVVIQRADRVRQEARRVEVTIKNTEHNGMIYHVFTVKLFVR
ncbi:RNase A-like domain-containing protein [Acidomonas methanolica]|uniref:RNase A-like domain-containing protein n=1 Tax=Acidomonas methanolica TaxID=437 RepID=UPI00211A56CE|nr:RNase A-like domain-containing protein [Acidomonas methanolica]